MATSRSLQVVPGPGQATVNFAYLFLYVPAFLSWSVASDPLLSFGAAWVGSWWILWVSMTGRIRPLPADRSWAEQLFRPLFLSQVMFFALFCLGPLFYMWDLAATERVIATVDAEIRRTAAAQRYYVLGHAAFVHGILLLMDYRRSGEWALGFRGSLSKFFLSVAGGALVAVVVLGMVPGLNQFVIKFRYLAVVAVLLGCAYAVRQSEGTMTLVGIVLYGYILVEVLLSGWKHQIILVVGLFLWALYPRYKKTVGVAGVVLALVFATLLPAYNGVFRRLNWQENVEARKAAQEAVQQVVSGQVDVGAASWSFLRNRLSTVGLFTDYIQSTPSQNPYYGLSTTRQAVYAIIPRVLWPSKPNTEELVSQRVYENTDVRPGIRVSAKPLIVTDGYLAGGAFGVLVACFLLGCVASMASRLAERWFGGYEIGGQLVYTGLFARVLFVASFEFLFNALFWSFVLMIMLSYGLWYAGLLRWNGTGVGRAQKSASALTASP